MLEYKELLKFQPVITPATVLLVDSLLKGTVTLKQFHNKKAHAKRTNNLMKVIELSVAFEIYQMLKAEVYVDDV